MSETPQSGEPVDLRGARAGPRWIVVVTAAAAVVLVGCFAGITVLSRQFVYGEGHAERPIDTFLALYFLAWAAFAAAAFAAPQLRDRRWLWGVLAIAAILRLTVFFSNPIQEADFYRYIWEGHVVLAGRNPAGAAPAELAPYQPDRGAFDLWAVESDPGQTEAARLVRERVSYPTVSTIYPHLAQAVFAVNSQLWGWDPLGFRKTLLVFDLLTLLLLWLILRERHQPPAVLLLYAWCPIVLKEITNSMHIDAVCVCLLAAFVLAFMKQQYFLGFLALFLASLVKITPLVLFPLAGFYLLRRGLWRRLLWQTAVMVALGLIALWIMHLGAADPLSGLRAFAGGWRQNDSIYGVTHFVLQSVLEPEYAAGATRGILFSLYAVGLGLSYIYVDRLDRLIDACGWALLALFLISPVGNPWYLMWLLPFYVWRRRWLWLAVLVLTSLYYRVFVLQYNGAAAAAFTRLQLAEYLPVFALFLGSLVWSVGRRLRRSSTAAAPGTE